MIDKRRFFLAFKLVILFIGLLVSICFTPIVFSKYESEVASVASANIAFYLLEENYYTQTMRIQDMTPRAAPYVYTFSVSNTDGTNRLQTDLEYTLEIVSTTNLPLDYELYLNQAYNAQGATNIITTDQTLADDDGMYFRTLRTQARTFGFLVDQTDTYNFVIYFPTTYISYIYQGIIENIEIKINSRQITE